MNSTPNIKIPFHDLLSKNVTKDKYIYNYNLLVSLIQDDFYSTLYKPKKSYSINTMPLNKKYSKNNKKNNNEILSKSIQEKEKKSDINNINTNNKSPSNKINALKRASFEMTSFISKSKKERRFNKKDLSIKNKFFVSSDDLGNITEIINKNQLSMSEKNFFDKIDNGKINNPDIEKNINKNLIKVNTKKPKGFSPFRNNKLFNNSKSNSNTNIILENKNINKSKLSNTKLHKKFKEKKTIKNIKYNISHTQNKIFVNEKLNFFVRKIKKIFLYKMFLLLLKSNKNKKERFRKNHNPNNKNKRKSKLLNISTKKSSFQKNKGIQDIINNNNIKKYYQIRILDIYYQILD